MRNYNLRVVNKLNCPPNILLLAYENCAELYYEKGDYQKSFEYINQALSHAKEADLNYAVRLYKE